MDDLASFLREHADAVEANADSWGWLVDADRLRSAADNLTLLNDILNAAPSADEWSLAADWFDTLDRFIATHPDADDAAKAVAASPALQNFCRRMADLVASAGDAPAEPSKTVTFVVPQADGGTTRYIVPRATKRDAPAPAEREGPIMGGPTMGELERVTAERDRLAAEVSELKATARPAVEAVAAIAAAVEAADGVLESAEAVERAYPEDVFPSPPEGFRAVKVVGTLREHPVELSVDAWSAHIARHYVQTWITPLAAVLRAVVGNAPVHNLRDSGMWPDSAALAEREARTDG